jgi:hypothetical protein
MFPGNKTPLVDGVTQAEGPGQAVGNIDVPGNGGVYPYCVLVQDSAGHVHLVEDISPPEMIVFP